MDGEGEGHHDHFEFSPLLIGLLGILAGSTMVAVYHCLSAGFRYRRGIQNLQSNTQHDRPMRATTALIFRRGPVVKYTKGGEEGVCAVCLSEFAEGEDVRVLSECTHSFHVACIDMWLHSHSNCPLCRAETGQSASHLALSLPESGGALPQQQAHNTTTVPPDNIGASMIVHYNL